MQLPLHVIIKHPTVPEDREAEGVIWWNLGC